MPEIVQARLDERNPDNPDNYIWSSVWTTQSVKATGRGKSSNASRNNGTPLVVYAHVPNYFSHPENILKAIEARQSRFQEMPQEELRKILIEGVRAVRPPLGPEDGTISDFFDFYRTDPARRNEMINVWLFRGAGEMPQEEFQRLLGMEDGERVFVVDHSAISRWPSWVIYGIDEPTKKHMEQFGGKIDGVDMIAINHPATKPFLGPKAEDYLKRHKMVFGNTVNITDCPDLFPESWGCQYPLGRLSTIGEGWDSGGNQSLDDHANFAGVRENATRTRLYL